MMSSYEQPTTPEKLPGIDTLAIKSEESTLPSTAYLPPPPSNNYYNNVVYHQHLSPPLTPAVSPSSVLIDSMQFKRKFSVDVGPFGFGTSIPHPSSMHDQDAYRRSSCSAVSMDCPSDYSHFLDVQQQQHQQQQPQQHYSPVMNQQKSSKRGSRAQLSGPNSQHKHACKYPYCAWSFKRYEHLKRHMLVHTGKRPHSCHFPGCGKNFSRSDNYHAHYRTHTKKNNLIQTKRKNSAAAPTATFDDTRTPAYFATKQQQLHQQQQSFDITSYQDMYSHGYGSEQSDDYPDTQYMRNNFTQQFSQQPNTVENNTAGVSSLLNHEVVNNNNSFYSSDYNNNNNNNMNYYQPYSTSTNDNSSIAAAVAVVAAAAAASSSSTPNTTKTTTTTNSRRSSSSNSISSNSNQQKSHICPVSQCQRRFKRLEHLKRHMRIHTLERPFGCSFPNCHKTFSRSDNLSQHMKTHQRVEDRRRRQQRNDEPMKQQNLPPLQEQNNNNMMVGMNWHNTGTVGC